MRVLPNLFIPGAQKSGSSSLCAYLAEHPACFVCTPKEPAYFSRRDALADDAAYAALFEGAGPDIRYTADGTTEYMVNPWAPALIEAKLGRDLKFIFILRSPVSRTYSAYLHLYKRGHDRRPPDEVFTGLPSDPAATVDEERRRIGVALMGGQLVFDRYRRYDDFLWPYRYAANSLYRRQVERYERRFGADRVLVLTFEQAVRAPEQMRVAIADFLDLDPSGFPETLPHENITQLSVRDSLRFKLRRALGRDDRPERVPPIALKPEPQVVDTLRPVFADETRYWTDRLGVDLGACGW